MIFLINSMLAWLMKTPMAIKLIEKWSYDYIKMDCSNDKCYGVLAAHRVCFALALFHAILSTSLIGVRDTRDKRAAVQNGYVPAFPLPERYSLLIQMVGTQSSPMDPPHRGQLLHSQRFLHVLGKLRFPRRGHNFHPPRPRSSRRLRAQLVGDVPRELGGNGFEPVAMDHSWFNCRNVCCHHYPHRCPLRFLRR